LKSFELAYETSMMSSPEAAKVIASYMQNQYPTAIDYMTQLGRMNAELANAMRAKEEAERLRLESLAREEEFRMEMEAQRHEREETERQFKEKMLELQSNIDQQHKSHEEMKQRMIEEREQATERYNQRLEEMQNAMFEQHRINEENKTKLIEEQGRKFEEMKRSIEEEHRKINDELTNKLSEEKEFYNRQLSEQMAAYQKLVEEMRNRPPQTIVVEKDGGCILM
jgi:hypothetical protein